MSDIEVGFGVPLNISAPLEVGGVPVRSKAHRVPGLAKTEMCSFWLRDTCLRGAECTNTHSFKEK